MTDLNASAFPVVQPGHTYRDGSSEPPEVVDLGLTKREYFAIRLMQSLTHHADGLAFKAKLAVKGADALIEALEASPAVDAAAAAVAELMEKGAQER